MDTPASFETFWSRIAKSVARLGCDTDAEKLAALRGVERLLMAQRLTFLDVADRLCGTSEESVSRASCDPAESRRACFGDRARWARDLDRGQLSPRERGFVADMVRRGFSFVPTPHQSQWLDDILTRLHRGRAAA